LQEPVRWAKSAEELMALATAISASKRAEALELCRIQVELAAATASKRTKNLQQSYQ